MSLSRMNFGLGTKMTRFILDTHTFLWVDFAPERLSNAVREIIQDTTNTLFVSMVSIWETQIKYQLGKLALPDPLEEVLRRQQETNQIQLLHISLSHIWRLNQLPHHHSDPFDRLLIAQSLTVNAILVSHDPKIRQYPVKVEW